jgi:broad specificity phosphatase PhoE
MDLFVGKVVSEMKFNLYVVRHGQTYFNIFNKLQGWSNSPLTHKGRHEAEIMGDKLAKTHFAAAYCSDTTRAMDTANIVLKRNQADSPQTPITSSLLRGTFYGYYEGNDIAQSWYVAGAPHGLPTLRDMVTKHSFGTAKDYLKEADPFHLAENDHEYWQRWDQGLKLIKNDTRIHDGDNVLLISHSNAVLSLVERFGQGRFDITEKPVNGGLTKLIVTDVETVVDKYNLH